MQFFSLYRKVRNRDLRFNGSIVWIIQQRQTIISLRETFTAPDGTLKKITLSPCELSEQGQTQERFGQQLFRFNRVKGRFDQLRPVKDMFKEIWNDNTRVYIRISLYSTCSLHI